MPLATSVRIALGDETASGAGAKNMPSVDDICLTQLGLGMFRSSAQFAEMINQFVWASWSQVNCQVKVASMRKSIELLCENVFYIYISIYIYIYYISFFRSSMFQKRPLCSANWAQMLTVLL